MSWMVGMPIIIASVSRSRRIWMNSLRSIAQKGHRAIRSRLRAGSTFPSPPVMPPLQLDKRALRRGQPEPRGDLPRRADADQVAAREEGEPVASLRLVHVVRGHQHGHPLGGAPPDVLPEAAPRGGVHARGAASGSTSG